MANLQGGADLDSINKKWSTFEAAYEEGWEKFDKFRAQTEERYKKQLAENLTAYFAKKEAMEKADEEKRFAYTIAGMKKELDTLQALKDKAAATTDKQEKAKLAKEITEYKKIVAAKEKVAEGEAKKRVAREKKRREQEEQKEKNKQIRSIAQDYTKSKQERLQIIQDEFGLSKAEAEAAYKKQTSSANAEKAFKALADYAKKLEGTINNISYAQTEIDTRLQGSKNKTDWATGSYWRQMNTDITRYVGMNAMVKQSDVVNNIKSMVGKGIAFNVEQRAFLQTISDKIATTFDATDATLVKLVRIQQADTTAARLGMESALTAFLNNMYETTEYMTEAASSIRANLYEASALMGAANATAFEYQVQKWMGSLYSVGFSNTSSLSAALGKLAAGDVSAITEGGMGNLMVMAANKAGISIADILAKGLDESSTNSLMQAMVEYLGGIYKETKNSKVVAQQFANVYGLTASDLKAAANLAGSTGNIAKNGLNYNGMLAQLNSMASTMYKRTSIGAMIDTLGSNLEYATASSIANNPALYSLYLISGMLDSIASGINIPTISVMGTGVDLEATVADLMRIGAFGGGLLEGMGKMIGGLASGNGSTTAGMLRGFGVGSGMTTVSRGAGTGLISTGVATSSSGYIGNAEGGDVKSKTLGDAAEDANNQLISAQDETDETKLSTVDSHVVQIYNLLQDVVNGNSSLHVDLSNTSAWSQVLNNLG